jgi:hypothetical protein
VLSKRAQLVHPADGRPSVLIISVVLFTARESRRPPLMIVIASDTMSHS